MIMSLLAAAGAAALLSADPAPFQASVEVTAPGPQGALAGTLIDPGHSAPLVLIIPGSGPTDRDGNNPLGVAGGPYRQLAEALAERGVASVRIDKRGMFGSRAAIANPNDVTIGAYAEDVHAWIDAMRARTGRSCLWLLGHSEGGLVALVAAQRPQGICGVILVSAAGRPLGEVIRAQLRANPANAPLLPQAEAALDALEAGRRVDSSAMPAPLQPLFAPAVQPYLTDLFSHDPARLAAALRVPTLIVQGDHDLQVSLVDADALAQAQPRAQRVTLAGVNHVLRPVTSDDRAANAATYANATLAISRSVPEAIARFITARR
jgi:uncharacterized protein